MNKDDSSFSMSKQIWLWLCLMLSPSVIGFIVWMIYCLNTQMDGSAIWDSFNASVMRCTGLLGGMLTIFVFLKKKYVSFSLGSIAKQRAGTMAGICMLIGFAMLWLGLAWVGLVAPNKIFPSVTEPTNEYTRWAGILYGILVAPIVEEFLFRGVLIGGLIRNGYRPWVSILLPAIIFSLLHHPIMIVHTMIFAIVAGWLFWRTGSLLPSIIIHVTNNTLSFIDTDLNTAWAIVVLVACLAVICLSIGWFEKTTPRQPHSLWEKAPDDNIDPSIDESIR